MNSERNKFKILVVDDDEDVRALYTEVFKNAGFLVFEAEDGLAGLELVNKELPDLVFTGIIMPKMDGFSLLENMRKNIATALIPVVFSSHLGRQEDQLRAKEMGVADFIVLGTTPAAEALRRVRSILEHIEYNLDINPSTLDADKFAQDLGLDRDFLCSSDGSQKLVLRLRVKDSAERTFEGEIVCL